MRITHVVVFLTKLLTLRCVHHFNHLVSPANSRFDLGMSGPKAPPNQFTLLYFAAAISYTRKQHDFFQAPLAVTGLYDRLEKAYPGFKNKVLSSCALTVNLEYIDLDEETEKGADGLVIQAGDEVAIIPPVSSG